jgi:hypothetical protein
MLEKWFNGLEPGLMITDPAVEKEEWSSISNRLIMDGNVSKFTFHGNLRSKAQGHDNNIQSNRAG